MSAVARSDWEEKAPNLTAATLPSAARDLLFKYYQRIHQRTLTDEEIATKLNATRDAAIAVHDYPCLRGFRFSYPRMCRHPQYHQILSQLPAPLSSITAVDIGTCMGADIRQLILEGFHANNLFGLEYQQEFLNIGMKILFNDENIFINQMLQCDILADNNIFIEIYNKIMIKINNNYNGVNMIYTGSVYHLFSFNESILMTKRIYKLLQNNGIFFGRTIGLKKFNNNNNNPYKTSERIDYFTEESFIQMLTEIGFINIIISSSHFDRLDDENHSTQNDDPHGRVFLAFMAVKPATTTNTASST